MTGNVSGSGMIQGRQFDSAAAGSAGGAAKGQWNGLTVALADDPMSLVADAAEEMTFAASETVEKDVTERKKPEKEQRLRVVPPPEEVMEQMRGGKMQENLAKLIAGFRASGGNPAALRDALASFSDPTERHVALSWLEGQLADEPSLRETVAREREALEAESAAEIQAGYNIHNACSDAAGGPEEGRDLYRRTILGHGGLSAMIDEVLGRHGGDDFVARVDFLRRAVGADLSAANPSTDKRDLESMNNDLYHLRALGNFTREFETELAGIREKGGKPPLPRAGVEAVRLLCKAKDERLVMLEGLGAILALEGEKDPAYDVRALSQTYRLAHSFPPKLFVDEESRQRLLDANQKLLDAAIDLEELMAGEE